MTPLEAWKKKSIARNPELPDDMEAFRLDLFPELQRTVGRQGIKAFGEEFYSPELGDAYTAGLRHVSLKYDPRDISRLYVQVPGKGYIAVPYRFKREGAPPSLWLLKAARRNRPPGEVVGARIAAHLAAERMEQLIEKTAPRSSSAARQSERLKRDRGAARKAWEAVQPPAPDVPMADDEWGGAFGGES